MPYQTLPFLFNFNFSSSISSLSPSSALSPSQAGKVMEYVDAAAAAVVLKSSLRPETAPPPFHLPSSDDFFAGDDFFVDQLLDFSEDKDSREEQEQEAEAATEAKDCCSASVCNNNNSSWDSNSNSGSCLTVVEDFEAELGVPTDDLASLEWVSRFVDDSFSETLCSGNSALFSGQKDPSVAGDEKGESQAQPESPANRRSERLGLHFLTSVPARARSKRPRTAAGGRFWSLSSPSPHSSTPSSSSSSSSPLSSPPPPSLSCLIYSTTSQISKLFRSVASRERPSKKPKRPKRRAPPPAEGGVGQPRRCSHCLVQKTPQWRTGPLGSKTLCNACGVRYKSGRLLPEYRPAGSPTFLSNLHSNSHRKVLEMRRKKDLAGIQRPLSAAVPS